MRATHALTHDHGSTSQQCVWCCHRRPDSSSPAEPGGEAALQGAAQRATLLDAELSSGDEDDEYEGSVASELQGPGTSPWLGLKWLLLIETLHQPNL